MTEHLKKQNLSINFIVRQSIFRFETTCITHQPTTKVFSKVRADGSNSAILLSFSNSFGRRNTMGQSSKN